MDNHTFTIVVGIFLGIVASVPVSLFLLVMLTRALQDRLQRSVERDAQERLQRSVECDAQARPVITVLPLPQPRARLLPRSGPARRRYPGR